MPACVALRAAHLCATPCADCPGAADTSATTCARLLRVAGPLPTLGELPKFLEAETAVPLPAPDTLIAHLATDVAQAHVVSSLQPVSECAAFALADATAAALRWVWTAGSEQHTLLAVEALFVNPLALFDQLAPTGVQLSFTKQRDSADCSTGMTSLSTAGKPVRPDFQLRSSDLLRLLMKGEDQSKLLAAAIADLTRKMAAEWSPLLYGEVPFLLCYAAAGSQFQLFAISRSNTSVAVPVTRAYDMTRLSDRVLMLRLAVQVHRLLQLVSSALPAHLLPVDLDDTCERTLPGGGRYTRVLSFEGASLTAKKRVVGWAAYAAAFGTDMQLLSAAYARTAHCRGVVHAARGPTLHGDTYAVALAPLGLRGRDAEPADEASLRAAAHGVLHGLAALHAAGVVHCDLRWDNVACEPAAQPAQRRYFLLDLEACRLAGAVVTPGTEVRGWSDRTLEASVATGEPAAVHRRYTAASDMECLGRMLRHCAGARNLSDMGEAFLAQLAAACHSARPTAEQALQEPWISCVGAACLAAGAAPLTPQPAPVAATAE